MTSVKSQDSPPSSAKELAAQANAIFPECVDLRRRLHSAPELSLEEAETARTISSFLSTHGLSPSSYQFPSVVCDTGPSPTVAIRADMDALPIAEESGEPFASQSSGVMHACGHDAHSAILACAGVLLARRKKRSVRLIFQPAEEIGRGAKMMISAGALEGIENIFGLHVWPSLATGTMAVLQGPAMAANELFSLKLKGTGGHGAYPHLAKDTITAASSLVMNANTIVSRNLDPIDSAVLSFGQIDGGFAPNVIPQEIVLKGTIRYFSENAGGLLKSGLGRMLDSAASTYGLSGEIEWSGGGPAVVNDREYARKCSSLISAGVDVVDCNPTMGSEDFAYYQQRTKGAFAFLGTGGSEDTRRSKHSPVFRLDEKSLYYGIMAEVLVGEGEQLP